MKVGDTFKSKDNTVEVEILDIDARTGQVRYILRDSSGYESMWADRCDIETLILNIDLLAHPAPKAKNYCWHPRKEKKWLLTTYYWYCPDCKGEIDE